MSKIVIYSTKVCPFCVRAKELLKSKNLEFEEIVIETDEERQAMMLKSGGRRTVPQIFINDSGIGGFDDLKALNDSGELDKILQA